MQRRIQFLPVYFSFWSLRIITFAAPEVVFAVGSALFDPILQALPSSRGELLIPKRTTSGV